MNKLTARLQPGKLWLAALVTITLVVVALEVLGVA